MKHISKEEFFNQLNSCEYGRQYLELVNNPENHLGKKDKGEVHHIHPRKLGGDLKAKENLVKLSIFNHCLAHVLLAKAAMQLHSNWIGESLMPIIRITQGQQFHSLSELEKITLEDIYNWEELKIIGYKEHNKLIKENWKNKSDKEKREIIKKRNAGKENMSEDKKMEMLKKRSESCKKAKANMSDEERAEQSKKMKKAKANMSEEEKAQAHIKKMKTLASKSAEEKIVEHNNRSIGAKNGWKKITEDEKINIIKKRKNTINNKSDEEKIKEHNNRSKAIKLAKQMESPEKKIEHYKKISEAIKITKANNKIGKIKVIKKLAYKKNSIKWILPEELDYYISLGYYQKVA